jgi:hypothetical protein
MVVGELVTLLTSKTLPEALPTAVGANATLKAVFCAGLRVRGTVSPLVEKPLPDAEA